MTRTVAWVLALGACGDPGTSPATDAGPTSTEPTDTGSPTGSSPTDSPPTATPPGDHTGATAFHTGAPAGGHTGGASGLEALVPGDWRPVSITQNGSVTVLPDDPATYLLLGASGELGFGCGRPALGTWTFDPAAPYPAIGILQVDLGSPVSWYLLQLDGSSMIYVEGGDQFEFARAACP